MGGLIANKRARHAQRKNGSSLTYDVVCVGRPSLDVILKGDIFTPICSHGSCYEHIPLGSKLAVSNAATSFGGNALNAAVTFARQKLSVALLSQIGTDSGSQDLLKLLEEEGIDSATICQSEDVKIGISTIISAPNGERSILAYPGSKILHQDLLGKLEKVETRWLYLSSLNSTELLEAVIRFATLNQIKVAFNPGGIEMENTDLVKKLLADIEVLILNKQEASKLFGSSTDSASLARLGSEYVRICIVTDGPDGAYAYDGSVDYHQPISKDVKVIDRNGAGDAFASGVISGIAWGMSLKESLELGSNNSTSVVQQLGSQTGILRR